MDAYNCSYPAGVLHCSPHIVKPAPGNRRVICHTSDCFRVLDLRHHFRLARVIVEGLGRHGIEST